MHHINKLKNKTYDHFNRCRKKASDKIQLFTIKTLQKVKHRGNTPQHNKDHISQTYSQHHIQWWTAGESIHLRSGTRKECSQGCPLLPLLFNTVLEVLATVIREEKERIGIQTGKEIKRSLSAVDMTVYTEDPKDAARKLPELINVSTKVTGCKINSEICCISVH